MPELSPTLEARVEQSARAFARKLRRMPACDVLPHVPDGGPHLPVHLRVRRYGSGNVSLRWHVGVGEDPDARDYVPLRRFGFEHFEESTAAELAHVARTALPSDRTSSAV